MRYLALSLAALSCALGVIQWSEVGAAQQPVAGFTPAQAQQGSVVYKETCAQCHGERLEGGERPGPDRRDVPRANGVRAASTNWCARSPGRCRRATPAH